MNYKVQAKITCITTFFATFFGAEVCWQMFGFGDEGVAGIQAEDHKCLDELEGCLRS